MWIDEGNLELKMGTVALLNVVESFAIIGVRNLSSFVMRLKETKIIVICRFLVR